MRRGALALVVGAGAVLRFATLDAQSLWYDEAVTARLLRLDLGAMLRAIPDSESTPPLYYVLAWLWTHVFGTGEVGLRSFSALLGTTTIVVVWAIGRRLGGDRAALAAAALAAVNPMLVWFSQEARAYALLGLLGALSTLLWLRALESDFGLRSSATCHAGSRQTLQPPTYGRRHTRRTCLLTWGAVAALALATHYYAAFLVAPQALWLLLRVHGRRERAELLALPAVAAAVLAPLAFGQRENDTAGFITGSELLTRLAQLPKQFLVGYDAPLEPLLVAVTAIAVLAGIGGLAAMLSGRIAAPEGQRSEGARLAALAAAALALPVLAALAGEDHLITRNVLFVLPLACALVGAGLAAGMRAAPGRVGCILALCAASAAGIVTVIGVAGSAKLQRDDWRAAVHALGPIREPRLLVATPASALETLRYYLPGLTTAPPPTITTAEIDYIALPVRLPGERPAPPRPQNPPAPVAGYTLAGRTDGETYTVLRWRGPAPAPAPTTPVPGLDGEPAVLLSVAPG
ncbi:MAG TPA: glycosyltransferase family 39 protein [Solirubrobacteraceae bacterium]|nr:glycosyltransferase family 39 protein [Solirubrobacteraceae bacterium]